MAFNNVFSRSIGNIPFSQGRQFVRAFAVSCARRCSSENTEPRSIVGIEEETPLPAQVFDDASAVTTFHGISSKPFDKATAQILMSKLDESDVEIKPDGIIYLPEIKYRRVLNQAFGPGGWALMPRGEAAHYQSAGDNCQLVTREYAMFVYGRFVAQTVGEHQFYHKGQMFFGKACEAVKSNAIMRCSKDLGIASELWDPKYIVYWKAKNAVLVQAENARTREKKYLWKKKEGGKLFEYPWKEVSELPKRR